MPDGQGVPAGHTVWVIVAAPRLNHSLCAEQVPVAGRFARLSTDLVCAP
jgi:hypothetical protein